MKAFFKRLFCRHSYVFGRNLYGDEIIYSGWNRSIWRCKECGKIQYRGRLWRGDLD